ncbi:hypothetical protein [Caballeronia sp. AZ7_KS35]|uniref:hypothetical protein n=1 Tax=Caballeronia sp. AZ7_KS35 TaxID=2921762 RepID=UPI002029256C|nr:hypothetical protein [Caballeronia sp. AZ7_KS35]
MQNHEIIAKALSTTDQIRFAISAGMPQEAAAEKYMDLRYVRQIAEGRRDATVDAVQRAINDGRSKAAEVKALAAAVQAGDNSTLEAYTKTGVIKAAVAPITAAGNGVLVYPGQQAGITTLAPQVSRSLIAMLKDYGAPALPPQTRALTQPANLSAVELPEGAPVPGAAPGTDFVLSGIRRFGLLVVFNNELLHFGGDEVIAFVEAVLNNAANNAVDTAAINAMVAAAGEAKDSVNAAFDAAQFDLRTAVWVGSPDTLGKLRSAQERDVSPRGGSYYGLPALPVLAAPSNTLFLMDATRTAVYDGPTEILRSDDASVVLDSDPASSALKPTNLFSENKTAFRVSKYADLHLMTAPVAVSVSA